MNHNIIRVLSSFSNLYLPIIGIELALAIPLLYSGYKLLLDFITFSVDVHSDDASGLTASLYDWFCENHREAITKEQAYDARKDTHGKIRYGPKQGTNYSFVHGGCRVKLNWSKEAPSTVGGAPQPAREKITLYHFGVSGNVLNDILREASEWSNTRDSRVTVVFRMANLQRFCTPTWQQQPPNERRPSSSVILDGGKVGKTLDTVRAFLTPETGKTFNRIGIPYRLGFLFHGPPGTGKTSLAMAIAGEYNLPIYQVSLSRVHLNDSSLQELFNKLPRRCLVLVDDADFCMSAISDQSREDSTTSKEFLTLSAFLQLIDGAGSMEGRILIMTAKKRDGIPSDLLRPGRIDEKIQFKLASREVIGNMFVQFYSTENAERNASLEEMASKFAKVFPEEVLTPADVRGFLRVHLDKPEIALQAAKEWIAEQTKNHSGLAQGGVGRKSSCITVKG